MEIDTILLKCYQNVIKTNRCENVYKLIILLQSTE